MSKTVIIKSIPKDNGWNVVTRYSNTKDYITPYYNQDKTKYIGLSEEDQNRLGAILRQDLNPRSDFWIEYAVVMTDKPKLLNLDIPEDELAYKFLIGGHFRIALSPTDPNVGIKDYLVVDEAKEAQVIMTKASLKIKANTLFSKLTIENKKDILKLYPNFVNVDNVASEVVDARLYEQLELDPGKFIDRAEDKKRDMKVLLKNLVDAEIFRKNKSSYYYGTDFIGHDEESSIAYIEDPIRQGFKIDLMAQLEKTNKKSK